MSQHSEYQSNLPDMPMKGHKFLIYFWIWAQALLGVSNTLGNIQEINSINEAGVAEYIKGMPLYYMQTALLIILVLYLIKVRFDLAKFKAGAPKALSIALIMMAVVNLIYVVLYSMNNQPIASNAYSIPIVNLMTMVYYRRYYNARDQYFVN